MGRSPCVDKLRMKHEVLANDGGRNGKNNGRVMRKTSDCLKQSFTNQEEDLIIKLHATIGSRWFIIAQQLPGRTDSEVKNIWNTKLRKKLTAMGIDPVTHRPFSQILADYGNIGASHNANKSRFGSLSRNMKAISSMHTSETESYSSCITNLETTRNPMISNNNEHNLLSQLEAIKLVSEPDSNPIIYNNTEYMSTHFNCTEFSESPSSSSNHGESSRFNWIDFLLEDESPTGTIQEQVNHGNKSMDMVLEEELNGEGDLCNVQMYSFEATMPSSRSFVEDILQNEHHMFSDFQGLAEDHFY